MALDPRSVCGCSGGGDGTGDDGLGTGGDPDPGAPAITPGAFLAEGGLVAVEFESSSAAGDWTEETALAVVELEGLEPEHQPSPP